MAAKSRRGRTRRIRALAAPALLLPPREVAIPHYRASPAPAAYSAKVFSRRRALTTAGAVAAGVAASVRLPGVARAHDLRPTDPMYRFDDYERIVNREATIRQVYEWPNLNNPIIFNNISNGLNGFQFSYDVPPQEIQVVVQAYSSANLAMYDDSAWATYRLGEIFNVKDPATGQPATRNPWYASKNPDLSSPPADRSNAYYSDISIQGLQRRGVLFLI
jgi:hypothetical protein